MILAYIAIFVTFRLAILLTHKLSDFIASHYPSLSYKSYNLSFQDKIFLCLNSIIETAFSVFVIKWSYFNLIPVRKNSPFMIILLFVCDDLLYAPYHQFLHRTKLYRAIHMHHHKIIKPTKGYFDASMEHPFEMLGALLLHALVLYTLQPFLDMLSVFLHLLLKALCACMNHSGKDIRILGLYNAKLHHIHHEKRTTNYAQTSFIWDRMLGTFSYY